MADLHVVETFLHGRNRYVAGGFYPEVDDDVFEVAVENGWGHAPGEEARPINRSGEVDLTVDTLTTPTSTEER